MYNTTTFSSTGKPGVQTHDILSHRVSSRRIANKSGIPFGVVVAIPDEGEEYIALPDKDDATGEGAVTGRSIGITICKEPFEKCTIPGADNMAIKPKLVPPVGNDDDYWEKGQCVSVLEEGSVWVRVFEAVKAGDPVKYTDTGDAAADADGNAKTLGMCGASGTELKDAVYETSADAFGMAIVRINR